ncbi:MAG: hypothetical protein ACXABY_04825 [Candidatus Thorarchaeota archaeon]
MGKISLAGFVYPLIIAVTLISLALILILFFGWSPEIVIAFTVPIAVIFSAEVVRFIVSEREKNRELAQYSTLLFDELYNHHKKCKRHSERRAELEKSEDYRTIEIPLGDGRRKTWEGRPIAQLDEFSSRIWEYGLQSGHVGRLREVLPSVIVSNILGYFVFIGEVNTRIRFRRNLMEASSRETDDSKLAMAYTSLELQEDYIIEAVSQIEIGVLGLCRDLQLFFHEYGIGAQVTLWPPEREKEFEQMWAKEETRRQKWYVKRGLRPPPTFIEKDTPYLWRKP